MNETLSVLRKTFDILFPGITITGVNRSHRRWLILTNLSLERQNYTPQ
jgi:hypothetical protein